LFSSDIGISFSKTGFMIPAVGDAKPTPLFGQALLVLLLVLIFFFV
jgi:hypothetical protein